MNKRLFKPGDIVVCMDGAHGMYKTHGVDDVEYGKTYMIYDYKPISNKQHSHVCLNTHVYLRKWNGFSGNIEQNDGNCSFLASRFKLKKDLTKEEVFEITKFKFGVKE